MSEEPEPTPAIGSEAKKRRAMGAPRAFPRMSLKKVLELPRAIYELGEGEQVRRLSAFDRLGKSPESGSSRTLITAANSGYGLSTGGYQAEYLGITERGKNLVASVDDGAKYRAAFDALFANDIFSAFVSRFYQKSVPSNEVSIDYLKREHKLSEADAKACWSVFRENIYDFGLVQELSGRSVVVSRAMALDSLLASSSAESTKVADDLPESSELSPSTVTQGRRRVAQFDPGAANPQIHFNIQIHLPDSASPEVYDAIFESIATHLLGRGET